MRAGISTNAFPGHQHIQIVCLTRHHPVPVFCKGGPVVSPPQAVAHEFNQLDLNDLVGPLTLRSDHDQSFPQRFDAFLVENGLVTIRTMHLTPIGNLVVAVLLGVLLWVTVSVVIGRPLRLWEAFIFAAAILALLEWWRGCQFRREREQTESLRDSALW